MAPVEVKSASAAAGRGGQELDVGPALLQARRWNRWYVRTPAWSPAA